MRTTMRWMICGLLLGSAAAQAAPAPDRAAVAAALSAYLASAEAAPAESGAPAKAVPRTDKAESVVIGRTVLVDATDFLDDGTPFRIVAVNSRKPFDQNVFVVCLGSALNTACGRLREGGRVQFTSDLVIVEDGESAGLALIIVKKIKT
jgi:hypothetical protein